MAVLARLCGGVLLRRLCGGVRAVGRALFQALLLLPINFARNSPAAVSKIEL